MQSKWAAFAMVFVVLLGWISFSQQLTLQPLTARFFQEPSHYLSGSLDTREALVSTERGRQESSFFGSLEFRLWVEEKGLRIQLSRLNLVGKSVPSERGETGLIGLSLAEGSVPLEYGARTGDVQGEFETVLHYELIDQLRGYQKQECRGECDLFAPYTERMAGKLTGTFVEPLQPREEGKTQFQGDLSLQLSASILGVIREIHIIFVVTIDWSIFEPSTVLRIQPVFIGTGPSGATGTAFNTLMNHAHEMWNRCGDVRCLKFAVNAPIYVNNNAYRVLDNEAEASALRAEVNVANAVEVFVVERMSTSLACSWGGGACFSSGTASAKIVSCDQQMAVPCPCPSSCTSYCPCGACLCGAINPYHLAHELGHALNLPHPSGPSSTSTVSSIMEPSGFCCDNPDVQSAKNCRNASNPLMFSALGICSGVPNIMD